MSKKSEMRDLIKDFFLLDNRLFGLSEEAGDFTEIESSLRI